MLEVVVCEACANSPRNACEPNGLMPAPPPKMHTRAVLLDREKNEPDSLSAGVGKEIT